MQPAGNKKRPERKLRSFLFRLVVRADSVAAVSARVSTVLVLLRGLLMILLLRPRRILVVGVAVVVIRMIGILIVLGRILLGVLGKALLSGIRPVGIVLIGRAIRARVGRTVILHRGVVIVTGE